MGRLRLMDAWDSAFGITPTSIKQAIKKSEADDVLREVLLEVAEVRPNEIDRKKLGFYLKKSLGRPIKGRLFELDTTFSRSANTYRLGWLPDAQPESLWKRTKDALTKHGKDPLPSYSSDASYSANSDMRVLESRKNRTNRTLTEGQHDLSVTTANSEISLISRPNFQSIDAFEV